DGLIHFSYGMVELPEGRMKSREGTVVDADDIIREMITTARELSAELGKLEAIPDEDKDEIFRKIGLGALKYFILKVDPKKNMTFNPAESIDFNGNTGPFIQYTYARIKSVMRKARSMGIEGNSSLLGDAIPCAKEVELIKFLRKFASVVTEASENLNPSLIANYCYDLAKEFNQYYHDYSILGEKDQVTRNFRLLLSRKISVVLFTAMWLLGIEMPERM
ncbi:MAG: arginine--tRNA ligase, partial [Bacteroidales bacterium]|nr:arginine--tRNA ligase [Bacteroidales bacterium]